MIDGYVIEVVPQTYSGCGEDERIEFVFVFDVIGGCGLHVAHDVTVTDDVTCLVCHATHAILVSDLDF